MQCARASTSNCLLVQPVNRSVENIRLGVAQPGYMRSATTVIPRIGRSPLSLPTTDTSSARSDLRGISESRCRRKAKNNRRGAGKAVTWDEFGWQFKIEINDPGEELKGRKLEYS